MPTAAAVSAGKSRKLELQIAAALSLLVVITRLPFREHMLHDWDSVNFSLALRKFDVIHHQPQPPGYILFVGLAKLASYLFRDPNTSFVTLAIAFSVLSAVIFFRVAMRLYNNLQVAVVACVLLAASPLMWFEGEIASIYTAGCFAALLVALTSWDLLERPGRREALISGVSFAIATALRPDQLLLMLPVWLFPFVRKSSCRAYFLYSLAIFVPAYLSWYLPTAWSVGGIHTYSGLVSDEFLRSVKGTSIFWGGGLKSVATSSAKVALALGTAVGFFPLAVVAGRLIRRAAPGAGPGQATQRDQQLFLAAWIVPSLLFYALIHMGQQGYVLLCLPALLLAGTASFYKNVGQRPNAWWSLAGAVVVGNALLFLAFPSPLTAAGGIRNRQAVPVARELTYRRSVTDIYFRKAADLSEDMVLVLPNRGTIYMDFRRLSYRFPDHVVFGVRDWHPKGLPVIEVSPHDYPDAPALEPSGSAAPDQAKLTVTSKSVLVILPNEQPAVGIVPLGQAQCADVTPAMDARYRVFNLFSCDLQGGEVRLLSEAGSIIIRGK
jgi:4-amino-4-deoxy-L-arabinose transferase-like glycosyltransferase